MKMWGRSYYKTFPLLWSGENYVAPKKVIGQDTP